MFRALAAGLAVLMLMPALAAAQDPVPAQPTPPSWDTLARCANMTDSAKELACYREAMKAAGYRRNPEVVAAEKRKTFGLDSPAKVARRDETVTPQKTSAQVQPAAAPAAAPAEAEDKNRIAVKIVEIAYTRPLNQLLIVTADGAVWEQTDTIPLTVIPKPGQTIEISRTAFGGYFCKFDRVNAVRCVRKN